MSNLNLLIFLNSYADSKSSNSPSLSNFKWTRELTGISASNPISQTATIAASGSQTLFTGSTIKKFTYLEVDQICTVLINGTITLTIKPIVVGTAVFPGILNLSSDITSLVVTNTSSTNAANVFLAAIE